MPDPTPLLLPDPPLSVGALQLRAWGTGSGDVDALVRAWTVPDIVAGTAVPDDRTPAYAAHWISGAARLRDTGVALDLVVTDDHDRDEVLGEVGLVVIDRARRWAEVGYWLFPSARGEGRAAIALDLLATWAFETAGLRRLIARTAPTNTASAAVARSVGFGVVGRLSDDTEVHVLDTPERPSHQTAPGAVP